jgi:hypothetical protein
MGRTSCSERFQARDHVSIKLFRAVLNAASRSLGNLGGEHTARAMVDAIARAGDRNRAHIQNLGIYSVNNGNEDEERFFSSFERTANGCTMIRRRVLSCQHWTGHNAPWSKAYRVR